MLKKKTDNSKKEWAKNTTGYTNVADLMGTDTPHSILTERCGLFSE